MTDREHLLCSMLEENSKLDSEEAVSNFIQSAQLLPETNDPRLLRRMLKCFQDEEVGGVQYELVEACERFPNDVYVTVLIQEIELGLIKLPKWFRLLLRSMLNNVDCVTALLDKYADFSYSQRAKLVELLGTMVQENPKYREDFIVAKDG